MRMRMRKRVNDRPLRPSERKEQIDWTTAKWITEHEGKKQTQTNKKDQNLPRERLSCLNPVFGDVAR